VDDSELIEFMALMPNSKYNPKDRYHDFHALFLGSELGKRVLSEILSWGKLFNPSMASGQLDQIAMNIRDGERNIVLRLLLAVNKEPNEKPVNTRKNNGKNVRKRI